MLLLICANLSAQRSKKPWNNGVDHNKRHYKESSISIDFKSVYNHFAPKNQNLLERYNSSKNQRGRDIPMIDGDIVNGINIAWIKFGRDTGVHPDGGEDFRPNMEEFEKVMDFVVDNGGNVLRWWYHTNGSTNPIYDDNQMVAPSPDFFHQDVKAILDLAQSKGLKVQICLWSFNMLKDEWKVDATANKKMLTENQYTEAYINNALIPLVNAIGEHPALFAWEIFNEPEGMTNEYGSHWMDFKERVEMQDIQRFINKTSGAIRRAQPNVKITNGALGLLTNSEDPQNKFWNAYSNANLINAGGDQDGYLDFYNVHYYSWAGEEGSPFHNSYDSNKIDKEAVIAEYFPDDLNVADPTIPAKELGNKILDNKWSGSLIWSWTDRNSILERDNMGAIIQSISDRINNEENLKPIADAGGNQTLIDSNNDGVEIFTLNGGNSNDPDGNIDYYRWTKNDIEIASGVTPSISLNVGVHNILLTVTDNLGATATDEITIIVKEENSQNNDPSKIGVLWTSWDQSHFANYIEYIDQLDSWGVEYLSLNPTYFINTYEEGIVTTWNGETKTPTLDTQKAIVKELISREYFVNYRPHLDPIKFALAEGTERDNLNTIPGSQDWRGKFDLLDPTSPTIRYKEVIVLPGLKMLAEAIREQGAPVTPIRFDLGAELMDSSLNYPDSWKALQQEVKNLLRTTYSDVAEHIVISHNYCHHIEYLLRLPNHVEYMDRIEPSQKLNPDLQFLDRDGVTYETLIKIGEYIAGLDEVSLSQYMPMDVYTDNPSTTTSNDVEKALSLHGENFIYEILMKELGIAPEDLPALHIGEYGMGIRGLTAPNVWDANAWINAGSGSLLLDDNEQKRQAAIGIDGIIKYVENNTNNYNSFLLWFGGAPYDLIGINEYSNWYNEDAANSLRDYWNSHSGAPVIDTPDVIASDKKDPIANAGRDQTIVDLDKNGLETVTLDGSLSSDPDGIISKYIWTLNNSQIAQGREADVELPIGSHIISLQVVDNEGLSSIDQVLIIIEEDNSSIPTTVVYEAEHARLINVRTISDAETSNGEYVYMEGNRGKITWEIEAPAKGRYQVDISYKVPFGTKRQWLNVNTAYMGELTFSGSANKYEKKTIEVDLREGYNTLTLTAYWGYMHFDYLSLNAEPINRASGIHKDIVVYPIPAGNTLTIDQLESGDQIYIYNLLGKTVLKTKAFSRTETIDISELKSGYYSIYVLGKNRKSFIKK